MKKRDHLIGIAAALLIVGPIPYRAAQAQPRQTVAEARVEHNAQVCEDAKLAKGCTQAQVDAAVDVPKGTVYATDAAYRDAVLLPAMLDKRGEERFNRIASRFMQAFVQLTPAERVAVCTAIPRAKLADPEACR